MINQYTTPLSTIGKIIFNLINAPSLNVALSLYFLKKKIPVLYEEVLLSELSSIEIK